MKELIYPKDVELKNQIFGHGGIRTYPVSPPVAEKIATQFKLLVPPAGELGEYFYINVKHGEQHELLFGTKAAAIERSESLEEEVSEQAQVDRAEVKKQARRRSTGQNRLKIN